MGAILTEIIYVPRRLVLAWKRKGYIELDSFVSEEKQSWAVPMVPETWAEEHLKEKWENVPNPNEGDMNG